LQQDNIYRVKVNISNLKEEEFIVLGDLIIEKDCEIQQVNNIFLLGIKQ